MSIQSLGLPIRNALGRDPILSSIFEFMFSICRGLNVPIPLIGECEAGSPFPLPETGRGDAGGLYKNGRRMLATTL
jgi:hypothetical protein